MITYMKTKLIICVSALAMILQGSVFAVTTTKTPNSFCPDISQVKKNQITQKWKAQTKDGAWKSYQTSFATKLTQFIGAQWRGVCVGQVTCVYKAEQRFTIEGNLTIQPALPVLLVFHALTFQPTKGKWKRNAQGLYNCYAYHKKNSPFKIRMQKPNKNVYQEAESLKSVDDNAV